MKDIASSEAAISAIGKPSKTLGHFEDDCKTLTNRCKQDNRQQEADTGYNAVDNSANERYSLSMLVIAAPRTAQFVVISGRKMPSAEYRAGINFFMNISTNCTSVAITRMNAMVCM